MEKLILLFLTFPFLLSAQVFDDFEDGDFTQNPPWTGTHETFKINTGKQLQLNDSIEGLSYMTTANSMAIDIEWRCWLKHSFSPSDNNNSRIYLVSNNQDITQPLNGYFLQFGEGGSNDAIELFKQDGEELTSICRGTDGLIAGSFTIRIKVIRDESGLWKVYADPAGGEHFQLQCEGIDNTFNSTNCFGFYCKYTKSNSTKMYYDDVYVGPVIEDNDPPIVVSVSIETDSTLSLIFNESLDKPSAEKISNYVVDNSIGNPKSASLNEDDATQVLLIFKNHFENGGFYTIKVSGVKDLAGNAMTEQDISFSYYQPQAFDVVFNEIMADPSPQVGLPNYEYLELYNQTDKIMELDQWKLTIGTSEKTFEHVSIQPGDYLIVAKDEAGEELSVYGPFYGFSSFALTNSGQLLVLKDKLANVISTVTYSDNWYKNPEKEDGGWSLEQINPQNFCSGGDNWLASENMLGGTPGAVNSVKNDSVLLPKADRLEVVANNTLRLFFNQAMDLTSMATKAAYTVDLGIGNPSETYTYETEPEMVELYFEQAFQEGVVYNLTVSKSLLNCMGVNMANDTIIPFGLGEQALESDIVINEILFNPWTNGVDYVEIYNRSEKVIDLNLLKIGTVKISPPNPLDTSYYTIAEQQYLLVPGNYLALTSSPFSVKDQYYTNNPDGFIKVDPFPAYNNDKGVCLLVTGTGEIIDVFDYSEEMHYPLLNYVDGVTLERTNFNAPTQEASNWHSAAESVGFGTPAYLNSQFVPGGEIDEEITIEPEIFSPDNDGYNDIISINYNFPKPGYMMTVNIFNAGGQLVRDLANNEYLGTEGSVNWDGIQDDNTKAAIGIYVFYIQVWDLEGNVKKYKKTGVLASKL